VRERDERRHQHGHRSGEWAAQTTQEWGEAAGQFDGAGCERIRADGGDDAPKDSRRCDAVFESGRRGAGQRVRAPAGEADNAKFLCAEGVGHVRDVGRPAAHRLIRMRVGQAGTRSIQRDDAQTELLSGATAEQRKLVPWNHSTGSPDGSPNSAKPRRRPSGR
jgi:hypothetical protein